jgi:acetyltransferase-like isoleucine patch superfamily enzyme
VKKAIRKICFSLAKYLIPELYLLQELKKEREPQILNSILEEPVKLYTPCMITSSKIGKYSYISEGAKISLTEIGRFCSIGPGLLCGWGIHPLNGVSTSPMFYSSHKQNGISLSEVDKIVERRKITIGNDVFIGANVTILDGVKIGDGAVIGAGTVVYKDIPPYAVVSGSPLKVLRYRLDHEQINKMLQISWWNWTSKDLCLVEKYFFEINQFIYSSESIS